MIEEQENDYNYDDITILHEFNLSINTREIFVPPNIFDSPDDTMIDHVVASTFIKNLHILNSISNEPIIIHQINYGGDWGYGMAIYDAILHSCNNPRMSNVAIISYGYAASMSSVILQAASKRILTPNTTFLMHWGSEEINSNFSSVVSEVEQRKKEAAKMLDIYVNRCKYGKY